MVTHYYVYCAVLMQSQTLELNQNIKLILFLKLMVTLHGKTITNASQSTDEK